MTPAATLSSVSTESAMHLDLRAPVTLDGRAQPVTQRLVRVTRTLAATTESVTWRPGSAYVTWDGRGMTAQHPQVSPDNKVPARQRSSHGGIILMTSDLEPNSWGLFFSRNGRCVFLETVCGGIVASCALRVPASIVPRKVCLTTGMASSCTTECSNVDITFSAGVLTAQTCVRVTTHAMATACATLLESVQPASKGTAPHRA